MRVQACDLFSGAGGFSLGAYLAGIDVVAAIERDKYACQTYRTNLIESELTSTTLFESDVSDVTPATVNRLIAYSCDILLGGPPCQGFSAHRLKNSGVNDPRNKLLLKYFEYVRVLRPIFFVVENVPGLLWPKHEKFLQEFYALGAKAGYGLLEPQVINARDFGVPQNRRRVFILGFDRRRVKTPPLWPPENTHTAPGSPSVAGGKLPWNSAAVAFETPLLVGDPNNIHMNHGPELIETFSRTPINGGSRRESGRLLPCHNGHEGHNDVYGRINPALPGPTMTTACINPSKGRFVHPTKNHGITLRQAARIQSFPDWFNFQGGIMAGGVQVGNAVPVLLAYKLLEPLRAAVEGLRLHEKQVAAA